MCPGSGAGRLALDARHGGAWEQRRHRAPEAIAEPGTDPPHAVENPHQGSEDGGKDNEQGGPPSESEQCQPSEAVMHAEAEEVAEHWGSLRCGFP
jgi:hypothetical protein